MKCEYDIKLKDGAKPFCLTAPRRVPLQSPVNDEIKRMLDTNVISAITQCFNDSMKHCMIAEITKHCGKQFCNVSMIGGWGY